MQIDTFRLRYGIRCVMPAAFLTIASSVVQILTLGYYTPGWEFAWYYWVVDHRPNWMKRVP